MKLDAQFRLLVACLGGSLSLLFFVYVGGVLSQLNENANSPVLLLPKASGGQAKERTPSLDSRTLQYIDPPRPGQLPSYEPFANVVEELETIKRTLKLQNVRLERFKKALTDTSFMKQKNEEGSRFSRYPRIKYRPPYERKRILVTGGSGFVGSHLIDRLMSDGHEVICLDNYFTGKKENVEQWLDHPNFELLRHDIVNPIYLEVDRIYHLASPASPPHYMYNPVKTIKTNTMGTINVLGLARRTKARVLLASTSEVYGDPAEHPQSESYWGNVNPVGPRSCYDEGKRVAEALMVAYHKQEKVDIRIARIFNTFGPRMSTNDGRVVSNFLSQALQNRSITVYGSGNHTRSFQYVSDLVDGLVALMESNVTEPVNFGNPEEKTILEFASIVQNITGCKCDIVFQESPVDDPRQRRPDISRAWNLLKWKPKVSLNEGLEKTIKYFKEMFSKKAVSNESPVPALR